jgi:hypothetical protein
LVGWCCCDSSFLLIVGFCDDIPMVTRSFVFLYLSFWEGGTRKRRDGESAMVMDEIR